MSSIVIVGASLAGIRAAEVLREESFSGSITVVNEEKFSPYNRPPLSKQYLSGEWSEDRVQLRNPEQIAALDLDFRDGVRAQSLDLDACTVALSSGAELTFDGLVIATGARNRSHPLLEGHPSVFSLRTLQDAQNLRAALGNAKSLLIVGGGFIGCEVASTARSLGLEVCIVEPQHALMLRGLGSEIGAALANLHKQQGVDIRCNTSITQVTKEGPSTVVQLSDGTKLTPDLIVVGIGTVPSTDWLAASDVACDGGVITDERCRVLTVNGAHATNVVAAGDIARSFSPTLGHLIRSEHWTAAQEQGADAARTLLCDLTGRSDEAPVHDPLPYIWSDQFGKKIQIVGHLKPEDPIHIAKGSYEEAKFLTLIEREGQLVGAIGVGMVPGIVQARNLLGEPIDISSALEKLSS